MGDMNWRILDRASYRAKVEKILIGHENNVPTVYLDHKGIPTIGAGRTLVVQVGGKWVVSQGRSIEGVEMLEQVTGNKLTLDQHQMLQQAADNLNAKGPARRGHLAGGCHHPADEPVHLSGVAAAKHQTGPA
ncbi:MAG: hypothetical protein H6922_04985 [Pseudomonadaceae bacterium]|nr:hypothetical protein [Pseudomonadaceae bacterium]